LRALQNFAKVARIALSRRVDFRTILIAVGRYVRLAIPGWQPTFDRGFAPTLRGPRCSKWLVRLWAKLWGVWLEKGINWQQSTDEPNRIKAASLLNKSNQ
jgi:hypothetical protein